MIFRISGLTAPGPFFCSRKECCSTQHKFSYAIPFVKYNTNGFRYTSDKCKNRYHHIRNLHAACNLFEFFLAEFPCLKHNK